MISLFKKTVEGLVGTRKKINQLFSSLSGKTLLDESDIEKIEELLLGSDLGWELTGQIIENLKLPDKKELSFSDRFLNVTLNLLNAMDVRDDLQRIILLVGINGSGKTTSAAKLGNFFSQKGDKVSLVAADTYRAAALEQIQIWSKRLNLHLISNNKSTDPASIAYDGVLSGMSKQHDRIIVDTSGRVHSSTNLMKELEKIYNVVSKLSSEVSVLMTIDANIGQNSIQQVKEFAKYIPIKGIFLTKMDGTAKGGIALQIMEELKMHVYFIGVGEQVDDLVPFDKEKYIKALIYDEKEETSE